MRVRLTFSKTGPLVFVGNLDLLTIWERAARRAGLGLQYSHGFHPQPKIQFAAPLPLGFSSRCEVLDLRLDEDVDCATLAGRLQPVLPAGITILQVESADPAAPPLSTRVRAAAYEITWSTELEVAELKRRGEALLAESSLPRERRGKRYDLRPLIESLEVMEDPRASSPKLRMRLMAAEGATGRPDEVLDALKLKREGAHIERTALILG